MYVRKEAVLSSQIEGTQSSLRDLLAAEAQMLTPVPDRETDEIVRYVSAMRWGLAQLSEIPVSMRLIRGMHRILLHGVRGANQNPGELRRIQNWIDPAGASIREATFVPPPPQLIEGLLDDLERYLHSDEDIPLLLKIGFAHAQFETIHPFLDGNGRIGRLLVTFLLMEKEILRKPVLYLSYYFKRYRSEYYERLQAIRDNGDWEGWLVFFLRGIEIVSEEATRTAHRVLELRERDRSAISSEMGPSAANGHRLLESLFDRPVCSAGSARTELETSYATANRLVRRLVDLGILSQLGSSHRNRRFIYLSYVDLFADA